MPRARFSCAPQRRIWTGPELLLQSDGFWVHRPSVRPAWAWMRLDGTMSVPQREHIKNLRHMKHTTSSRMQVQLQHMPAKERAALLDVQANVLAEVLVHLPHVHRGFAVCESNVLWNDPSVELPRQSCHTDAGPDDTGRCIAHQGYSILVALHACRFVVWPRMIVSRRDGDFVQSASKVLTLTAGSWVVFRDDVLHAGASYGRNTPAFRLHFASQRQACAFNCWAVPAMDSGFTMWTRAALHRIGIDLSE